MDQQLSKETSAIWSAKNTNQFKRYIDFIQFPYYRNIEIDSRINFEFPLTIFIGQNGCGKSSCLHALYGAPNGYTPYKFWFDTKVDPVSYYDEQRKRHSFWYSYQEKNDIKEVVKARIRRKDDPNYWETSRPLSWAGMRTRKDKNERDKPISKNVVYLDFRSELSAFDKFFYFGNLKSSKARNKQEFIRHKSSSLNNLFKGKKKTIKSNTRVLNEPVELLSDEELKWISYIMGRKYVSGLSVYHELFRNSGYSVLFRTEFANYSEAVAGSGEMAIVRLVREVLAADKFSLILLDEPEVSLHPGAQNRLQFFLLDQIKKKKHQIILTSHSPSLVKGLPKEAIKVFYQNPRNGRFLIKQNVIPEEAFYHIEFPVEKRKNIIVEDVLAQEIVLAVMENMGEAVKNMFNVKYNPGGESVIKKEFIPVLCRESISNNYILFDGDQQPSEPHLNWKDLPTSDCTADLLKIKIKVQTGEDIRFSVDGGRDGGNNHQRLELQKMYLDFYLHNVFYLPGKIPEDIIWDETLAHNLIQAFIPKRNSQDEILARLQGINETKQKFALMAEVLQGKSDAETIGSIQKQFLQRWLHLGKEDYQSIKTILQHIMAK